MKVRNSVLILILITLAFFGCDGGKGGNGDNSDKKERLYARMEAHTKAVFEHYGDRIEWWDVCNEVIDHDDYKSGGARKDSDYTKIMESAGLSGMDRFEYVLKAFQWARQYADEYGEPGKVKLYLTDYGVERPFGNGPGSKQQCLSDLVDWLIEKDAPIDGVGFQGHFRLKDHPVEEISEGIDKFAKKTRNGTPIKIQVCELDFSAYSNHYGDNSATSISPETLPGRLSDLADNYGDFFDMFEEKFKAGKLDMVLIWGVDDGHSWLNDHPVKGRTDYPLLFGRDYKAKAAFKKVFGTDADTGFENTRSFKIGVAVPGANTSNAENNNALAAGNPQNDLLKYFDVYVAENEMKPENIMPAQEGGSYNWTNADALVKYADDNGKKPVRGHTLFWHSQTPDWFFK
uniref:Beta-xylanase n=1 Tax=uncultured bacterium 35A20 TaxID=1194347 RepID=K7PES0_9BACT|nr:glycosyl hydrolase family 10 [uncultured bacterium 35A20]